MVEPDQVSLVEGDSITTPDVAGVDVSDSNVPMMNQSAYIPMKLSRLKPRKWLDLLDDDVLDTVGKAQTTALDNTASSLTNQGLVGADVDTEHTSVFAVRRVSIKGKSIMARVMGYSLGDGSGSGIGLVVVAPVVLVDSNLAVGGSTERKATAGRGGALTVGEVETSSPPLLAVAHP